MSSSKRVLRNLVLALGLSLSAASLGACSLTPAYADRSAVRQIAITYPDPANRLAQIVYQEMRTDFGDAGPGAPVATIAITETIVDPTKAASADLRQPYITTLNGVLTITAPKVGDEAPRVLFQATRQASATYTSDGQSLADTFAVGGAREQAARELAESLRLAILASYAGAQGGQ